MIEAMLLDLAKHSDSVIFPGVGVWVSRNVWLPFTMVGGSSSAVSAEITPSSNAADNVTALATEPGYTIPEEAISRRQLGCAVAGAEA